MRNAIFKIHPQNMGELELASRSGVMQIPRSGVMGPYLQPGEKGIVVE